MVRMPIRTLRSVKKLPLIMMWSSDTGSVWKITISCEFGCQTESVFQWFILWNHFYVPTIKKSHRNLNSCPSTIMQQGTKLDHCEYNKNDSPPVNFIVWKSIYGPICALGDQFCSKWQQFINNSPKTTANNKQSQKIMMPVWLHIKYYYDVLDQQKSFIM